MATKPVKRPRDPVQLAKLIGDIATGQVSDDRDSKKVTSGRTGGLKGGRTRMDALTPEQRKVLAQQAATARWKKTAPVVETGAAKRNAAFCIVEDEVSHANEHVFLDVGKKLPVNFV